MSWHNLDLNVTTLEAETVNNVWDNIDFLLNKLELTPISHDTVTYADHPLKVGGILTGVESALTTLCEEVTSAFYNTPWTLQSYFKLPDYQRWVNILNDLYDIIVNGKGQWGQMVLTAETGSPNAQDKYGNNILIRGDRLG